MSADFDSIFARLCGILRKHAGTLAFKEAPGRCSLEGAVGPATLQAWGGKASSSVIPVAWAQIGKSAVSFHLMGLYGNAKLQDTHPDAHGGSIMPEMLRWLWRDYSK